MQSHSKLLHLLQIARSQGYGPYVEATCQFLQQDAAILTPLAEQLTEAVLLHYSHRLLSQVYADTQEALVLELPQATLILGPEPNTWAFQSPQDRLCVEQAVQHWLADGFVRRQLWSEIGAEVWVNVLTWSLQDIDTAIGESVLQALAQDPFQPEICQTLFDADNLESQHLLQTLEVSLVRELAQQLLACLNLDQYSFQDIEQFLGLRPATEPVIPFPNLHLTLGHSIAEQPATPLEEGSELVADQETEFPLEAEEDIGIGMASPLFPERTLRLEHYLTRPSDLALLPWELVTQLKQKGGPVLLQLQWLLAAHAMRQPHPTAMSFTLKASDLLNQLAWQPSPEALVNLVQGMEQLKTVLVNSLWMTDPQSAQVEAFNISGHPWEILTDARGNLDWTTGQMTQPEQVYFAVRPGLWIQYLLQYSGAEAERSFTQFGQFALTVLKLDYCRDPLLLSLLTYLLFHNATLPQEARSSTHTVSDLLAAALVQSGSPDWSTYQPQARALFRWWRQALEALLVLGWSGDRAAPNIRRPDGSQRPHPTDFYLSPYPDWLHPNYPHRKPPHWFEEWLTQPLILKAPRFINPTASRSQTPAPNTQPSLELDDRRPVRLRFERLTGAEIRTARKAKQLTQAQLAEALQVHQSLIAKIEVGRRAVTDDLEPLFREFLEL
ncbi:MAG: helix-turn-helix transcriptional regulator [Thermosynechococcaceae cyanobacterium]